MCIRSLEVNRLQYTSNRHQEHHGRKSWRQFAGGFLRVRYETLAKVETSVAFCFLHPCFLEVSFSCSKMKTGQRNTRSNMHEYRIKYMNLLEDSNLAVVPRTRVYWLFMSDHTDASRGITVNYRVHLYDARQELSTTSVKVWEPRTAHHLLNADLYVNDMLHYSYRWDMRSRHRVRFGAIFTYAAYIGSRNQYGRSQIFIMAAERLSRSAEVQCLVGYLSLEMPLNTTGKPIGPDRCCRVIFV